MRTLTNVLLATAATLGTATGAVAQDGLTLYHPFNDTTTYLVDSLGTVVNAWPGTTTPGLSVYFLPDGDLMRTRNIGGGGPGGIAGGLERISYDGTVEWQFTLLTSDLRPHHDIEVLPNGNVLLIVWEEIGGAAAIALGRDPNTVSTSFIPDGIYEVQPTGMTGGTIVWEWHAYDHLVQDFDASLPNFDVIADRPERIDINVASAGDWLHINGIDYNPELDQIALSVPRFHELWIIDHSTTTAEAAGSTGGNSGMGGDLLYRWGNPQAYGRGTATDQVFYTIHDVQWVLPGRPGAGNITVFNNGNGRPSGNWSSVDEITPPVDGGGNYTLVAGQAYGPAALTWTYSDVATLYSNIMSGAERLENGNTLITEATSGTIFEVTPAGSTVWTYVNPFGGLNWVFKAHRYADCDANSVFDGADIAAGAADSDANGVLDACQANASSFCDASDGALASCPCANPGAADTGCDLAQATGGARIDVLSQTSSPQNRVTLQGSGFPAATSPTALVIRAEALDPSSPVAFGDGLRCVGTPVVRLGATTASAGTSTHVFGHGTMAGAGTFYYQLWFRNTPGSFCTPEAFNLSNGRALLW